MAEDVQKRTNGGVRIARYSVPAATRMRLIQRSYMRMIVDLAIAFTERYGEEAWKIMQGVAWHIGEERTQRLKERFEIDPSDARSVTKFLAFETAIFLASPNDYKILEYTPTRHVTHVLRCAQADEISRCPDLCMRFFDYMDQATYQGLGVKIKKYDVPLRLSKGDPYCETVLEIEGREIGGKAEDVPELPKFEIPLETKIRLIQNSYMRIIVDLSIAFTQRWGETAWDIMKDITYRIGLERAPKLKERFNIDPTDLRSINQYIEFESVIFLSRPEDYKLPELTQKRKVEHILSCSQAQHLKRCPDLCMRFLDYIEQGTFDALGVKIKRYEVPLRISKGDPYCETIIELE